MELIDKRTKVILTKATLKSLEEAEKFMELVNSEYKNKIEELHKEIEGVLKKLL